MLLISGIMVNMVDNEEKKPNKTDAEENDSSVVLSFSFGSSIGSAIGLLTGVLTPVGIPIGFLLGCAIGSGVGLLFGIVYKNIKR